MARVRYIVDDVEEAVAFYTSNLGIEIKLHFAPAIAILVHGDLTYWSQARFRGRCRAKAIKLNGGTRDARKKAQKVS